MPLLLLLSALLTALTGVVTGARPADVQIARQAGASDARRVVAAIVPAISGHAHLLGAFGAVATFASARAVAAPATPAQRLYLDRLRA